MATLRRLALLVRDVPATVKFYNAGLGLQILGASDEFAILEAGPVLLHVRQTFSEASLSRGYSPLLSFDCADMDGLVPRLLSMGATLDGRIEYTPTAKVASLRGPCGHMLTLVEPQNPDAAQDHVTRIVQRPLAQPQAQAQTGGSSGNSGSSGSPPPGSNSTMR
jgi:hypothetical protein